MRARPRLIAAILILATCALGAAVWRLFQPPTLHPFAFVQGNQPIDNLEFTSDGKFAVATGGDPNLIRFYNPATGDLVRQISAPPGDCRVTADAAVIYDSPGILASTYFAQPPVSEQIDGESGAVRRTWRGRVLGLSSDGSILILGVDHSRFTFRDRVSITVIGTRTGKALGSFEMDDPRCANVSGDNRWMTLPGPDASKLVYLPTFSVYSNFPALIDMQTLGDDHTVVGVTFDNHLFVYDAATGRRRLVGTGLFNSRLGLNPDGGFLVEGNTSTASSATQFRSASGALLKSVGTWLVASDGRFSSLIGYQEPDNGADCEACDSNGRVRYRIDIASDPFGQNRFREALVAASPDGRRFVAASGGLIRFYDVARPFTPCPYPAAKPQAPSIAVQPDEMPYSPPTFLRKSTVVNGARYWAYLDARSADGKMAIYRWDWRSPAGKQVGRIPYVGTFEDVRDNRTGALISTLDGHDLMAVSYTFSADDSTVACGVQGSTAFVWSTATGRLAARIDLNDSGSGDTRIALSPGGRYLAVAFNDGAINLYSVASGLPVAQVGWAAPQEYELGSPLKSLSFSSDGKYLRGEPFSASPPLSPDIWDVSKFVR